MFPTRRILVVDDNIGATRLMSALLKKLGQDVIQTAHDGQTALAAIQNLQPDIAFLDIGIPELNGLDVAREVRKSSELDGVQLVAVTGHSSAEHREQARVAGFNRYFVKPVGVDDLKAYFRDLGPADGDPPADGNGSS